jgi:WD40 repeat protein/serine/threonine protein kinase
MEPQDPKYNQEAYALYLEFVRQSIKPDALPFDTFCRMHSDLAADLRGLHGVSDATIEFVDPGKSDASSDTPSSPGRKGSDAAVPEVPRYRMDGEIGRGGMGAILKVWDGDLHRTLAMKVILGEDEHRLDDGTTADARLSRFLEEAQITGQLDHPGVVPVHELGVDKSGRMYFTMRLVKGRDLGEIIEMARSGKDGWNRTRALNVLHRVCETMAYAHTKGVVHRDLKPDNIMVGQFGETYAMDWGLARVLGRPDGEAQRRQLMTNSLVSLVNIERPGLSKDSDSGSGSGSRTQQGSVLGTPCYMPPEQAAGELETIGPQSDIYAVGAILYHLLTGKRPYEQVAASAFEVVRAVLQGPPIAVHRLEAKVPPELIAICERAMAREPVDRYPSMVEMAADLQAYLENRVVKAYQHGAVAEFIKWVRRNRAFSAALAALVFLSVTALIAFAWMQSEKAIQIEAARAKTEALRVDALAQRDLAQQQGYLASVTAANACLAAGEAVEARRHLEHCPPALRQWEWFHLSLAADASTSVLEPAQGETVGGVIADLAWDAASSRLVSSATDGTVRLWQVGQTSDRVLPTSGNGDRPANAPVVAFLDDGRKVIAIDRDRKTRVRVWNAETGELERQFPLTGVMALYAIAVSPAGDRAAFGATDHSIHIVDLLKGVSLGQLIGHRDTVRALSFSSDGVYLASGAEDRAVRVWNVAQLAAVGAPIATAAAVHAVAFAPAGRELAVGLLNGNIWRCDSLTGMVTNRLDGHPGGAAIYDLCYDGDGTRLASASSDKTVRVWDVATGQLSATMAGHEQAVHCVQFAAGTTQFASGSADGSVRLWNVEHNRATTSYLAADLELSAVAIGGDGTNVVIGSSYPGTIEVIDANTGNRLQQIDGPEDSVLALAMAPDGNHFAVAFEEDISVCIGDLATGRLGEPLRGHDASVRCLAWAADGATLFSGAEDRTVRVWDVASNKQRGDAWMHDGEITALALSSDGQQLAVGMLGGSIQIRDVATAASVRVIPGDGDRVRALACAPHDRSLAVGHTDGVVRIFAPNGALLHTLKGHEKDVVAVRYSLDGLRLISASKDGTLRVWDCDSGRLALTLRDHAGPVTGVAIGGVDMRVVSTSYDGTLLIRRARAH